ncbi:hypothetical protein K457DRAFT_132894 [Linnemannia elongata AG-77]|uniref:Uncharacterized protein n=1 Tax=Linnemannia elongata AG-77 TaxID=1314771 RepID=A0A197KF39_9FUNG|nr:hypothetical protein K457DRAFT_132894 [Linnemannia elongata AG-77]
MYHSMVQGNEEMDEPRWNEVLRFIPGQSRNNRSSTSLASRAVTIYDDSDESSPLLASGLIPTRRQVSQWTNSIWKRQAVLLVLPVSIVIMWCSVPLRTYPDEPEDGGGGSNSTWPWDGFPWTPPSNNSATSVQPGTGGAIAGSSGNLTGIDANFLPTAPKSPSVLINFWWFLWFYYGFYNAVALLLITKIFNIYSLNWWPKRLGGLTSYFIFWLSTQLMGILVYYFTGLEVYRLTWVFLTFCTMTIPLFVAFLVIRSENRNVYRHSLTVAQKTFLSASSIESRIPASYIRFLWFCVALAIALSTIVTGELYADQYIQTSRNSAHTTMEGLFYVYTWVGTIYILDAITDYIVETRVRSYPLSSIFKLYYFMIYFIFYRNLFVRLRSYEQFLVIQLASSFWVCIFHPICMTHTVYRTLVYLFGISRTYEEYKRQVGRSLFLRNLAENVTMLAFLLWVNILYYGPNAKIYSYFKFEDLNIEYNHDVTVYASVGIWTSELISNFINRMICKKYLRHHVTKEALKDFKEYPELIVAFVLVMVHILQDMLLSLLDLSFA